MELLNDTDKQAVAAAIRQAEDGTSGEIVFAVTDASARYLEAAFEGALLAMAAFTAAYLVIPFPHTIRGVLWTEIIAFGTAFALITYFPWRRWFIRGADMNRRVHDSALMEFYSSGLHRTREANGVLIYLSLLERTVVVLGDRAIHEKMGTGWNDVRDRIIRGVREGRAREGICEAIAMCGRALAEHFPRRTDDINELPDQVIDRRRDQ
jgi:putative membrane protein